MSLVCLVVPETVGYGLDVGVVDLDRPVLLCLQRDDLVTVMCSMRLLILCRFGFAIFDPLLLVPMVRSLFWLFPAG